MSGFPRDRVFQIPLNDRYWGGICAESSTSRKRGSEARALSDRIGRAGIKPTIVSRISNGANGAATEATGIIAAAFGKRTVIGHWITLRCP